MAAEGFQVWKEAVDRGVAERGLGDSDAAQSYDYEAAFNHGRSPSNAIRDIRDGRQFESSYDKLVGEQTGEQTGEQEDEEKSEG